MKEPSAEGFADKMTQHFAFSEPSDAVFHAPAFYPSPSDAALTHHYIGRKLKDVQAPAAVLDVAVIRRNCKLMLDTVDKLGVSFRAHVKTHKVSKAPSA